jgi:hypothetical protein
VPRSRYTRGRIRRVHPNGRINYHGEPPTGADGVEPAALAALAAEIAQEAAAAELVAAEAGVEAGAAVVSFLAAVLTGIYQGNVSSCQEVLRRNGRGQERRAPSVGWPEPRKPSRMRWRRCWRRRVSRDGCLCGGCPPRACEHLWGWSAA